MSEKVEKAHRLSWTEQQPDWALFPTMKQVRGRDGWYATGFRADFGWIWCLQLLGVTCQFKDVGSPSGLVH